MNELPDFELRLSTSSTVVEDLSIGEQIGEIIVEDPLGEGLEFSIAGQTDTFRLEAAPLPGAEPIAVQLLLARELDFEHMATHRLDMVAENADGEESTVPIVVMVSDVDELPVFAQAHYQFSVVGTQKAALVGMVKAVDPENRAVLYRIDDNPSEACSGLGVIDEATGQLSLTIAEASEGTCELMVAATDPVENRATTMVTLQLSRFPFSFEESIYEGQISEGVSGGYAVLTVSAVWGDDVTDERAVVYELQQIDIALTIDSTSGAITTTEEMNYETASADYATDCNNYPQCSVTVSATSGDAEAFTQVQIELIDVNEAPRFEGEEDPYLIAVREIGMVGL